jgi:hypothetical protein
MKFNPSISLMFVVVAMSMALDGAPIVSNHSCTPTSTVSSGSMSSGLMDLEEPNDAGGELAGTLTNTSQAKLLDVKIWFEKSDGTKIENGSGASPVSGLATHAGATGTLSNATLASNSGGVATFNLSQPINANAFHSYEAQVDSFTEPANYFVKVAFSTAKAGKHYEFLGEFTGTQSARQTILDGNDPTIRTGVMIAVRNGDAQRAISSVKVTLASNLSTLKFSGGEARTYSEQSVSGSSASLSDGDKSITFTGFSITNPDAVAFWLDLNAEYAVATSFKVQAIY